MEHRFYTTWYKVQSLQCCLPQRGCPVLSDVTRIPPRGDSVSHTLLNSSMLESALLIAPCWPMAVPMASARACQGGHHHLLLRSLSPSKRVCCRTTSAQLFQIGSLFLQGWTRPASAGHSVAATWRKMQSLQCCMPQGGCPVLPALLEEEAILACLLSPCMSGGSSLAHALPQDFVQCHRRLKVYQGSNVGRAPCLQRFSSELHQLQKAHLWRAQAAAPKPGQGVSHTLLNSSMLESALLIAPCWPMAVPMASARACQGGHHHLLLRSLSPSKRVCRRTTSAQLFQIGSLFLQGWTRPASAGHSVAATWRKMQSLQCCMPQGGCPVLPALLEEEAILACLLSPCMSGGSSLAHALPQDFVQCHRRLKVYQGSNVGRAPCLQRFSSELHQLQKAHLWRAQVAAPKPGQGVSHTLLNSSTLESALLIAPCWPMAVPMASARACQGGHHHLLLRSLSPSKRVCCRTTSAQLFQIGSLFLQGWTQSCLCGTLGRCNVAQNAEPAMLHASRRMSGSPCAS